MPLLELAHVEADHQVLVAEQRLGERPRELGLADAGRAEEEEAADRPVRVAEPGARAAHRLRRRPRPPRPGRRSARAAAPRAAAAARAPRCVSWETGMPVARETTSAMSSAVHLRRAAGGRLALLVQLAAGALDLRRLQRRPPGRSPPPRSPGRAHARGARRSSSSARRVVVLRLRPQAHPRAGLVDQVDRLVGQEAVADVAVGQLRRRHDRLVGDPDAVERLVAVLAARAGSRSSPRPSARARAPAGTGARARRPSRCSCGTRRASSRRSRAARRAPAPASACSPASIGALGGPGADDRVHLVDEEDQVVAVRRGTSSITAFSRSSNSPRYFVPAIMPARSSATSRLVRAASRAPRR